MKKWQVHAEFSFAYQGHIVYVVNDTLGKSEVLSEEGIEVVGGGIEMPHLFKGAEGTSFLQSALDCAWKLGMRPTGYDVKESRQAVDKHLADMRAIAFHQLKITAP